MRIIAGTWRSRRLEVPRGTRTRPTTDRVREALFQHLTAVRVPDLERRTVLDLFAGSGALALEALSRGAPSAVCVEADRAALAALRANVASLNAPVEVVARRLPRALQQLPGADFGLVFADPPYATLLDTEFARRLRALVREDALWVYEHAADVSPDPGASWEVIDVRMYGATAVTLARPTVMAQ